MDLKAQLSIQLSAMERATALLMDSLTRVGSVFCVG